MFQSKLSSEPGKHACATAAVLLGLCSLSTMALSYPVVPSSVQEEIRQLVKKKACYKLRAFTTKSEAKAAANNAEAQGSSASVTQAANGGWVVKVCEK